MPSDTIQARMETIRELFDRLYPLNHEGDLRTDEDYPHVLLSLSSPHNDSDCDLESSGATDESSGPWKASVYGDVQPFDGVEEMVGFVEKDSELAWFFLASRGSSPEQSLDRLLEQLKQQAAPILEAIANAEKARDG